MYPVYRHPYPYIVTKVAGPLYDPGHNLEIGVLEAGSTGTRVVKLEPLVLMACCDDATFVMMVHNHR